MNPAKIDHELLVDEHPHVVVAGEAEFLARRVCELSMNLVCKMIIIPKDACVEKLSVNREERTALKAVDPPPIGASVIA